MEQVYSSFNTFIKIIIIINTHTQRDTHLESALLVAISVGFEGQTPSFWRKSMGCTFVAGATAFCVKASPEFSKFVNKSIVVATGVSGFSETWPDKESIYMRPFVLKPRLLGSKKKK